MPTRVPAAGHTAVSPSPTAGRVRTRRRTRSRRSPWRCGWAPPGSRATCGSPPTARPCSTTTAWSGARPAARADRAPSTAADLPAHIPTLADLYATCGTDFELSLDVKDPAPFDRVVAVARAAGGDARRAACGCATTAGSRWSSGGGARDGRAPRRLDPARPHQGGPRAAGRHAGRRGHRRGQHAPPRLDRRPDHAVPPLRRAAPSAGTPSRPGCSTSCSTRHRRRLQRPRRPHGRRRGGGLPG